MIIIKVVDYHVHSDNSFDGKSNIEKTCQRAIEMKLQEICFTEHFSVDPRDVSFGVLDYQKYTYEIIEARKKYEKYLLIKKGLEIGEPHLAEYKEILDDFLINADLDFIIGSVHNINGVKLRLFMKDKTKYDIYQNYFEEIYKMIEIADIDIIGHMDLAKRYAYEEHGNYEFQDHIDIISKILNKAIEKKIGLEINCSGLRDKVNEVYPKVEILKLYKELGGDIITVGSDSHEDKYLALHNLEIMNLLKKIGFSSISIFEKRTRKSHYL